jgi:hypothetical protein
MQATAGNIYNHTFLQAVGMTNLQGSYLQRIEISHIDLQDLSNKVNVLLENFHFVAFSFRRWDAPSTEISRCKNLSNEAKTCCKIHRLSFTSVTRMSENGSTVSRRTRKSQVTWSNLGEGIKHV